MKRRWKQAGFTLLELMTVVAIIGILSAIAIPNFMNAAIRAKVAKAEADIENLVWSLEMYFVDFDEYPTNQQTGKSLRGDLSRLTTPIPYMNVVPRDIFLSPNKYERKEYIQAERDGNPNYRFINFLSTDGNRVLLKQFGLEGSANYAMYSFGPGFSADCDPMIPNTFIKYNPSNGTTSHGAVLSFGP
jgi:general secretion pathway protein G